MAAIYRELFRSIWIDRGCPRARFSCGAHSFIALRAMSREIFRPTRSLSLPWNSSGLIFVPSGHCSATYSAAAFNLASDAERTGLPEAEPSDVPPPDPWVAAAGDPEILDAHGGGSRPSWTAARYAILLANRSCNSRDRFPSASNRSHSEMKLR